MSAIEELMYGKVSITEEEKQTIRRKLREGGLSGQKLEKTFNEALVEKEEKMKQATARLHAHEGEKARKELEQHLNKTLPSQR